MNYLILKITGKAFDADTSLLRKYVNVLKDLSVNYRLIIVTGGGSQSRKYIEMAKDIGVESNYWLDLIGIWVSRINSLLLISALRPHTYPYPATSLEEAITASESHRIVVMGGLLPGQSTASVLLELGEALGSRRVYYYSAIGRVYDKDPAKHPDAKPYSTITITELRSILEQRSMPGEYALIDLKALDIAMRSGIEIQVLDYRDPEQIRLALQGENPGTVIIPR